MVKNVTLCRNPVKNKHFFIKGLSNFKSVKNYISDLIGINRQNILFVSEINLKEKTFEFKLVCSTDEQIQRILNCLN